MLTIKKYMEYNKYEILNKHSSYIKKLITQQKCLITIITQNRIIIFLWNKLIIYKLLLIVKSKNDRVTIKFYYSTIDTF